jgi:hypothetical protein
VDNDATHAILSGWPSPTDSEVKRKVPCDFGIPLEMLPMIIDDDDDDGLG